jgi:hypothetical protein
MREKSSLWASFILKVSLDSESLALAQTRPQAATAKNTNVNTVAFSAEFVLILISLSQLSFTISSGYQICPTSAAILLVGDAITRKLEFSKLT